jgi:hypothetical protein
MFRRSKSIRELYDEAKGFDLVITSDPALATGLNHMIDHPRIGAFALTPRHLAARYGSLKYGELFSIPRIIAGISASENQPVRIIHPLIEKIFGIWRNTGLLENCEHFLNRYEFEISRKIRNYPTIELCMEEFDENFIQTNNISVAGASLFNLLDQQVLPKKKPYSNIDLFKNEDHFPVDKTYLFMSSNDMVNAIIDNIGEDNANSTAIVINFDSHNLTSLKTRLHNKGISIIDKKFLSSESTTQDLLKILDMSFRADDLTVNEIRQLSDNCNLTISRKYDEWMLSTYVSVKKDEKAFKAMKLLKKINDMKLGKAIVEIETQLGMKFDKNLNDAVALLNLSDRKSDESTYNELSYFIKNIDVETERTKSGVLIANSQNSAFVNREIVYYVGMDSTWTKLVGDVEYIDKAEEEIKNIEKFQILLAQGEQRYYLATAVTGGEATIPCHYFNILLKKELKDFDDKLFQSVIASSIEQPIRRPPEEKDLPAIVYNTVLLSQSKLKAFYQCPKKYAYSFVIPSVEYSYLTKGTLIHNFAEFCFDYPEFCRKFFDKILDRIVIEFSLNSGGAQEDIERSQFRIAMEQVLKFVESLSIEKTPLKESTKLNFLYIEFKKDKKYSNSEFDFEKIPPGIRGKIDILSDDKIYDFKSSYSAVSVLKHISQSNIRILNAKKSPEADFQVPMYLLYLTMQRDADSEAGFNFVYPLAESLKFITRQKSDVIIKSLRYIPEKYFDYLCSLDFYGSMRDKFRTVKKFSHERWVELMMTFRDKIESGEDISNSFTDEFRRILCVEMNLSCSDFNRKEEHRFEELDIKPVGKHVQKGRIDEEKRGLIFEDDIKNFEDYLGRVLKEVNEFESTDFPYRPAFEKRKVCYQCEYLSICTGNKLWEGSGDSSADSEIEETEE